MEYVHVGLPVVASRLPAIERYFDDDSVRLFDAGSARRAGRRRRGHPARPRRGPGARSARHGPARTARLDRAAPSLSGDGRRAHGLGVFCSLARPSGRSAALRGQRIEGPRTGPDSGPEGGPTPVALGRVSDIANCPTARGEPVASAGVMAGCAAGHRGRAALAAEAGAAVRRRARCRANCPGLASASGCDPGQFANIFHAKPGEPGSARPVRSHDRLGGESAWDWCRDSGPYPTQFGLRLWRAAAVATTSAGAAASSLALGDAVRAAAAGPWRPRAPALPPLARPR